MEELEATLSKELSPVQTKQAIQIFRGFVQGATAKEKEEALVDYEKKISSFDTSNYY